MHKTINECLQAAVIDKIRDPSFQMELPKLSSTPSKWQDRKLGDIIEFAGDNLMYSCVSQALLKIYPSERKKGTFAVSVLSLGSRIITFISIQMLEQLICQVVTTNETFYHCMLKAGASTQVTFSKRVADEFETRVGAYQMENSFEALCDWVLDAFRPIITACEEARHQ